MRFLSIWMNGCEIRWDKAGSVSESRPVEHRGQKLHQVILFLKESETSLVCKTEQIKEMYALWRICLATLFSWKQLNEQAI